jgi:hypothetical protein
MLIISGGGLEVLTNLALNAVPDIVIQLGSTNEMLVNFHHQPKIYQLNPVSSPPPRYSQKKGIIL